MQRVRISFFYKATFDNTFEWATISTDDDNNDKEEEVCWKKEEENKECIDRKKKRTRHASMATISNRNAQCQPQQDATSKALQKR